MIKVVFLIRSLNQGGAERQLTTLVSRLNKARFDVTVITFYAGGVFAEELAANNVKVFCLNKKSRWDLTAVWRLLKELRRQRPAILHSYLGEPNLIAVLLKPLLKSTKVVWGIRSSARDISGYDWFIRMNWKAGGFFSRFADLIIFNSINGRDYHLGLGYPSRTSTVIQSGVDIERFKPDRELGRSLRSQWTRDTKTVLIGLVGRLDPIKDHSTFLHAAAQLAAEELDCKFVCVGVGTDEYAENLRRLSDELGLSERLVWAGLLTDMPAVYNALDIVCSSSRSESLPNVIAEAMACDIPCVVTNVGDAGFLVGDTGFVVAPNDSTALADGLRKAIESLGMVQRPRPRQRILETFDVNQLVEHTEAVLAGLVSESLPADQN